MLVGCAGVFCVLLFVFCVSVLLDFALIVLCLCFLYCCDLLGWLFGMFVVEWLRFCWVCWFVCWVALWDSVVLFGLVACALLLPVCGVLSDVFACRVMLWFWIDACFDLFVVWVLYCVFLVSCCAGCCSVWFICAFFDCFADLFCVVLLV